MKYANSHYPGIWLKKAKEGFASSLPKDKKELARTVGMLSNRLMTYLINLEKKDKKKKKKLKKRLLPVVGIFFLLLALNVVSFIFHPTATPVHAQSAQTTSRNVPKDNGDGCPQGQHNLYTQPNPAQLSYCVNDNSNGAAFPCADTTSDPQNYQQDWQSDWLAGDPPTTDPFLDAPNQKGISQPAQPSQNTNGTGPLGAGHLMFTYANDTYAQENVVALSTTMTYVAVGMITPVLILIGYQMMLAASGFRYAGALESLSRLVLSIMAIAVCSVLVVFLIDLANSLTLALIQWHVAHPFPATITVKNVASDGSTITPQPDHYDIGFTLDNDAEAQTYSYRGLVMPINRWGCAANDFVSILSTEFITSTLGSIIPIFGNFVQLAGKIASLVDLAHHIGEFVILILSISLSVQVFMRIIFINFYIVMAPPAFACWALPGGVGENVIKQWFKGFTSVLAVQVVQVFVLTTAPLLIPHPPSIPLDTYNIVSTIFPWIPPILVLLLALRIPNILGTSSVKALTSAGTLAGGTVAAVGMAINNSI